MKLSTSGCGGKADGSARLRLSRDHAESHLVLGSDFLEPFSSLFNIHRTRLSAPAVVDAGRPADDRVHSGQQQQVLPLDLGVALCHLHLFLWISPDGPSCRRSCPPGGWTPGQGAARTLAYLGPARDGRHPRNSFCWGTSINSCMRSHHGLVMTSQHLSFGSLFHQVIRGRAGLPLHVRHDAR